MWNYYFLATTNPSVGTALWQCSVLIAGALYPLGGVEQ